MANIVRDRRKSPAEPRRVPVVAGKTFAPRAPEQVDPPRSTYLPSRRYLTRAEKIEKSKRGESTMAPPYLTNAHEIYPSWDRRNSTHNAQSTSSPSASREGTAFPTVMGPKTKRTDSTRDLMEAARVNAERRSPHRAGTARPKHMSDKALWRVAPGVFETDTDSYDRVMRDMGYDKLVLDDGTKEWTQCIGDECMHPIHDDPNIPPRAAKDANVSPMARDAEPWCAVTPDESPLSIAPEISADGVWVKTPSGTWVPGSLADPKPSAWSNREAVRAIAAKMNKEAPPSEREAKAGLTHRSLAPEFRTPTTTRLAQEPRIFIAGSRGLPAVVPTTPVDLRTRVARAAVYALVPPLSKAAREVAYREPVRLTRHGSEHGTVFRERQRAQAGLLSGGFGDQNNFYRFGPYGDEYWD